MALTDTLIRTSKPSEKARKLADGGGMYLEIAPDWGQAMAFEVSFWGQGEAPCPWQLP